INIGESSLVTISRLEQDPLFSQRQSVVYLNEGEIWGRVRASKSSAGYLEIITPFASARVLNHKNSLKEARFRVNVNADKSTSIVVYDGTAEVVAGDEIIQVPDNHQVIIDRERHVSAPTPLLSAVKPKIPKQQELYYFQELVPLVKFEWDTRDRAEQYRLILARDPLLREVIIDKTIKSNDFRHGNLLTGQYFWQIYATRGSRQGALSELRSLQLIKDNIPPLLKVQGVDAVTSNGAYLIRGTTEAGATVFVNGQAVSVDPKGIFEKTINLNPGYNLIVIEAMDAAKNMSYQTTTVNYQAHR
ncbi:MAG: hypothetical protein OEW08_05200, partial [Gammaproteobacteria bacterium]|nr:hypothetical protein [Gammaproteobacteria bacterium]